MIINCKKETGFMRKEQKKDCHCTEEDAHKNFSSYL